MHKPARRRAPEKKKDFIAKEWISDRPIPRVSDDVWGMTGAEEIAFYVDWHARHPCCVTPRKLAPDEIPDDNEVNFDWLIG